MELCTWSKFQRKSVLLCKWRVGWRSSRRSQRTSILTFRRNSTFDALVYPIQPTWSNVQENLSCCVGGQSGGVLYRGCHPGRVWGDREVRSRPVSHPGPRDRRHPHRAVRYGGRRRHLHT